MPGANVPLGTYNITVTDTATGAQTSASIDVIAPGDEHHMEGHDDT